MTTYYLAEEPFYSIQGEGLRTGSPTVFIRMAGCNATPDFQCWKWCDSKFSRRRGLTWELALTEAQIANRISLLPRVEWVCITGGEPMLQDLGPLVQELIVRDLQIQVETNGTVEPLGIYGVHHYTVSPKTPHVLPFYWGMAKEAKFVVAEEADLRRVQYPKCFWGQVFLQPESNKPEAVAICLAALKERPEWRLSLQIHKIIGVS